MSFLQNLSDELLASLCQTVGLHQFQPTSGTSSSLHRAWQSEVSSLRTTTLLTDEDLRLIRKYVNLQELCLGTKPSSPYGRPVWFSVAKLASSLTDLIHLRITSEHSEEASSYNVLKTLVASESLRTRLQHLEITTGDTNTRLPYIIGDDTIHALSDLEGLRSLNLQYQAVTASHEALRLCASQLSALSALTLLCSESGDDMDPSNGSKLAIFPGSLTNLISLCLKQACYYSEFEEDPDTLKNWQQQHLIAAVSALRNLEDLETDYPILTLEAQQQVLGHLTRLTSLTNYSNHAGLEVRVLERLASLKQLTSYGAQFPAGALLQHACLKSVYVGGLAEVSEDLPSADRCGVTALGLLYPDTPEHQQEDSILQHLPLLPQLEKMDVRCMAPTGGRYLHLAALIRRQAAKLRNLTLELPSPFDEAVCAELPQCEKLGLLGCTVSVMTLQLMQLCTLPKLDTFVFRLPGGQRRLDVAADLSWLRKCEALQVVYVLSSEGSMEEAVAVRDGLAALLPAAAVYVEVVEEENKVVVHAAGEGGGGGSDDEVSSGSDDE